tara:strand:- start:1309 stop:1512 length:204 start_codon:yes stop_codon:yes gene_type:complete
MQRGDLVKWNEEQTGWHLANSFEVDNRQHGVVISASEKYVFVHWQNGDRRAEEEMWLDLICPGSSAG